MFLNNIEAQLSHLMEDIRREGYFLLTKYNPVSIVNQESATAPRSNCAAAESTTAADNNGPLPAQSTGTLEMIQLKKEMMLTQVWLDKLHVFPF